LYIISEIRKEMRKKAIKSTDLPVIEYVYADDTSKGNGKSAVHPRPGHKGSEGQ
jgi:hypothetical protein